MRPYSRTATALTLLAAVILFVIIPWLAERVARRRRQDEVIAAHVRPRDAKPLTCATCEQTGSIYGHFRASELFDFEDAS